MIHKTRWKAGSWRREFPIHEMEAAIRAWAATPRMAASCILVSHWYALRGTTTAHAMALDAAVVYRWQAVNKLLHSERSFERAPFCELTSCTRHECF